MRKHTKTYKNIQERLSKLIDNSTLSKDEIKDITKINSYIKKTKLKLEKAKKNNNKNRIEELENDLGIAEDKLKQIKSTLTEDELAILEVLNIKQEITAAKEKEEAKTTKRHKSLNTILIAQTRKKYTDNNLCPYCHNQNSSCKFEKNKQNYVKEKRGEHIGQDEEGIKKIDAIKASYKGKTIKVKVINKKTEKIEEIDYDIGKNMKTQYHHIISLAAYNMFVGLAAAMKQAGFDVNVNEKIKNNDTENEKEKKYKNIKCFPSMKVTIIENEGSKDEKKYYLTEKSKEQVAKKIQEITQETLHLGPHTSESINLTKSKQEEQQEKQKVYVEDKINMIGIELDEEQKISYEELVIIELGAIQEGIYKDIIEEKYKCSEIDKENKEMRKKIIAVIEKLSKHFYSISKYGIMEKTDLDKSNATDTTTPDTDSNRNNDLNRNDSNMY